MVYTGTSATVKRILLKLIDTPVRALGMDSPDLLELVLECPHGSETLVIRMLYILTETGEGVMVMGRCLPCDTPSSSPSLF